VQLDELLDDGQPQSQAAELARRRSVALAEAFEHVLEEFRARAQKAGTGYQTMMNDALRQYLSESDQPVTEKTLRQVLRQEMPEYLRGLKPAAARKGLRKG